MTDAQVVASDDSASGATAVSDHSATRSVMFAVLLIVGGALGLWASFALTIDGFRIAADPNAALGCSFNSIVTCDANIASWQGKVFGFSNPLLGLMMFPAPIVVGFAMLAGAKFKAWFWWLFAAGMTFAIGFIYWLSMESIFVIRTLCPWCALVYVVVIPMWVGTMITIMTNGSLGEGARKIGVKLRPIAWLIAVLGLLLIFGLAQIELDIIGSFL